MDSNDTNYQDGLQFHKYVVPVISLRVSVSSADQIDSVLQHRTNNIETFANSLR
jgi:hypothetical protein